MLDRSHPRATCFIRGMRMSASNCAHDSLAANGDCSMTAYLFLGDLISLQALNRKLVGMKV